MVPVKTTIEIITSSGRLNNNFFIVLNLRNLSLTSCLPLNLLTFNKKKL